MDIFRERETFQAPNSVSGESPLQNRIPITSNVQEKNTNCPVLPFPANYYSDTKQKRWSCPTSFWPFALGTLFGTALWPLLFTFILFLTFSKNDFSDPSKHEPRKVFNSTSHSSGSTSKAIHFKDIAGMSEAKQELSEIVHFLQDPEPYRKIGARLPKGVLLSGPPGSGKTMLANAVATEAGIPYVQVSGSEFVEIYVGQGAKRVRKLFEEARNIAPCVIFIDEIDSVGSTRSIQGPSNREHDQTLNQLLVELDGFTPSNGIIILAATNRIDTLDPALLRPGRFDRIVQISLPDIAGRKGILKIYLSQLPFDYSDQVIDALAKKTAGFSGADLSNMVNEAALLAASARKLKVTEYELNLARDKVSMGPERHSLVLSEKQKCLTAYHESGHALVAYYLRPYSDPIHQITIISRGNALGYVEQIPDEDQYCLTKAQLEARLAVTMGGRAAETIVFGTDEITNGASGDIRTATHLAIRMVCEWGMSDKVGPLHYQSQTFDYSTALKSTSSTKASNLIEEEIKNFITLAQKKAETILKKHRHELELVVQTLLEKETIQGGELQKLLETKKASSHNPLFDFFNTAPIHNLAPITPRKSPSA